MSYSDRFCFNYFLRFCRRPIRSILNGQIAKLVLIQLQFVKKELLEAMQAIDELFNANQVSVCTCVRAHIQRVCVCVCVCAIIFLIYTFSCFICVNVLLIFSNFFSILFFSSLLSHTLSSSFFFLRSAFLSFSF